MHLKNFPVDELLKKNTGVVSGEELVQKLQNGTVYTRQERMFLVKVVAKYLMSKCSM